MNASIQFVVLALCLSGCASDPRKPAADLAPHRTEASADSPPPSSRPKRPPFLLLSHPPASDIEVLSSVDFVGRIPPPIEVIQKLATAYGTDGAFLLPDDTILRPDTGFGVFSPRITVPEPQQLIEHQRFVFFRFAPHDDPYIEGVFDDASGQFLSGQEVSLYAMPTDRTYSHFGRYVRSPFARDRPPVNIVGLPDGATVVCPYTNRIFVLW